MRVIFVLPGRGGGGGAHSVVQETIGLQRLGVDVAIAVTHGDFSVFRKTYPELDREGISTPAFTEDSELRMVIEGYDLAVATTAPSAHQLASALEEMPPHARPRAAYYVQDYEPLFFAPGTPAWTAARDSYTALGDCLLIAKTDWLCRLVHDNHNQTVVRVLASLDHAIYHPKSAIEKDVVTISAMIRPKTPRRAPRRTIRILERLATQLGGRARIVSFGCEAADLEAHRMKISDAVQHQGVLSRGQVADTLRSSDLFLDLSDFQAFGRTGLEAMACGCVPLLPIFGGADEYAHHRENALLVDTRSDEAILELVGEFLANSAAQRGRMRRAALRTAATYSIERAAFSEYEAFSDFLEHGAHPPVLEEQEVLSAEANGG